MSFRSARRPCGMAMPCPTPVVPRRSRSTRVSNTLRSGWRTSGAARAASSCSSCFLPCTFSVARTAVGWSRSEIFMGDLLLASGGDALGARLGLGVMVLELAFVTPQLGVEVVESGIKGAMGVGPVAVGGEDGLGVEMERAIGAEERAVMAEHDMGVG